MVQFGDYVRALRIKRGISQRQCAFALEITPTYMSKIERGEFPPPSEVVIKKMAVLLEEDSDLLLAIADKVDSQLIDIILSSPAEYAALIRNEALRK